AFAGILVHDVARLVDIIDVVAEPAGHRVVAAAADEAVVAAIADHQIVERIAGRGGGGGAGEHDLLDIGGHGEGDGAHHRVVTARSADFGRTIPQIGDDVGVVAIASEH